MTAPALLLSCEHGGHEIPAPYRRHFRDAALLKSHRGWDAGALLLAKQMSIYFDAPLHAATTSRLLVDLNRSAHHPRLFSEFSRPLPDTEQQNMLNTYYHPYRQALAADIEQRLRKGPVLHISVHSFTPVLEGQARNADIGLLYDPARENETALCLAWQSQLAEQPYRVRRNYPYRGVADGLVTALRRRFDSDAYIGIELETSQQFVQAGGRVWADYRQALLTSLAAALEIYNG